MWSSQWFQFKLLLKWQCPPIIVLCRWVYTPLPLTLALPLSHTPGSVNGNCYTVNTYYIEYNKNIDTKYKLSKFHFRFTCHKNYINFQFKSFKNQNTFRVLFLRTCLNNKTPTNQPHAQSYQRQLFTRRTILLLILKKHPLNHRQLSTDIEI